MKKLLFITLFVLSACTQIENVEEEWFVVVDKQHVHHAIVSDKYYVYLKSMKSGRTEARSTYEQFYFMFNIGDTCTMRNYYTPETIKPKKD